MSMIGMLGGILIGTLSSVVSDLIDIVLLCRRHAREAVGNIFQETGGTTHFVGIIIMVVVVRVLALGRK